MIFYFSGTGNSYQAARAMCAPGEQPLDMAECLREERFRFAPDPAEPVGFVFPVYYGGLPGVVADFLKRLLLERPPQYCFAVLTCGSGSYAAPEMLAKALHARGVRLHAAFTVIMPDNYVIMLRIPSEKEQRRMLAAAAEQLGIWAERAGADFVRHEEGSDPGAVVYDGICAAKARGSDVIIIDTAGRLHNKQNLMNELAKISRIINRELPEADVETLMVLDATTGQNGLIQAKQFLETSGLTGIVLTKLDGTAKGGIVFAIANELKLPVKYVGVGEGIDDLIPFDPNSFVTALFKK